AAARAAVDAGITFFDTAPGYGDGLSERRLGLGLEGLRQKVVVATKIGPDAMAAGKVAESVERSLRHLRSDYIDLIQIHWPSRSVPLAETLGALEALKRAGKVRAIGVSNFGALDLADAVEIAAAREIIAPTTNQLPYSLLSRAIEFEIMPACARAGVGVLCYSPLLWGLLAGSYEHADQVPDGRARSRHFSPARKLIRHKEAGCEQQTFQAIADVRSIAAKLGVPMSDLAVAWLLHQPGVSGVLTGIRRPEQADANVKAIDLVLDRETLAALDRVTQPVKQALGSNADLWQSGADTRFR
ncbi:MAG TPA: aldo/keto reductase, partial [Polyangiaceae bacterium]|nr:aldo/keto reductase [Polyangiaceae bacterium]